MDQPEVKPYQTWCSPMQRRVLERLRLEAAWAVLTCLGGVCDLEECRPGKKWSRTLNFMRANFWLHGFLLCFTVTFLCAHH